MQFFRVHVLGGRDHVNKDYSTCMAVESIVNTTEDLRELTYTEIKCFVMFCKEMQCHVGTTK